jgi:Domain of unknown function (DUF5916)/Carbohydrate family 9 binding domain-like
MNYRLPILLLLQISFSYCLSGQSVDSTDFHQLYRLHIKKASGSVKIDAELNEPSWTDAETSSPFFRKFPNDEGRPKRKTEVKITYDNEFMYVAFISYDTNKHIVQSLKRDVGHDENDGVAIILDPVNQRTNGFFFVVNSYNVQSDDLLSGASGNGVNFSWDNKWFSATKRLNDKWIAEIAIPFKTLRYEAGKTEWGINFLRVDMKSNEYSTWTHVPRNFRSYDLGYTGLLQWDAPPPKPGSNVAVIPYLTGGINENREENQPLKSTGNAGFDAKIALSSALNLDLTVNPDFSQIEVDRQVTNLSRFSIFFPERRTFFLENADLFAEYGIPPIRPFYSRRIGLDNNANRIPILFGARLSGNVAKRTRIGMMSMQTGKKGDYAAQNYSAVSVSQSVFKRSTVKGYFLNREGFLTEAQKKAAPLEQYGRNGGIELNYVNLKGTWNIWNAYHRSWKPGITKDNAFLNGGFNYSNRNLNLLVDFVSTGTNYYTDLGFVNRIENYDAVRDTSIRLGFKHSFINANYRFFPKGGKINQHQLEFANFYVLNPDNTFNELNQSMEYSIEFSNTSGIGLGLERSVIQLLYPISFTDAVPLPARKYDFVQAGIGYESDKRKLFNYELSMSGGQFYNGNNVQVEAAITWRKQPHLNLTIGFEYNKLIFPQPYGNTELFLISPRLEYNFSTKLFWTTFLQYNTQANNFNINSRFQWRYKPMSDFFLVYTDNYFTDPLFKNKSRAIVFKMNYWLNL